MDLIERSSSGRSVWHLCQKLLLAVVLSALSACASFPMAPDGATYRSADGSRSARVTGAAIFIDEQRQKTEYEGITNAGVVFSPNGRRTAYLAVREKKVFLVIDGVEYGPYDNYAANNALSFSATGELAAFVGIRNAKWLVSVNGTESNLHDDILVGSPVFSPDGSRFAYGARAGAKWMVVTDGKEGKPYDGTLLGTPVFSPDSARVGYGALIGQKWRVVMDGVEGEEYDGFLAGTPVFAPSGGRFGYAAKKGQKWLVVTDGVESDEYDDLLVPGPVFSPDGSRIAFGAREGGVWKVIAGDHVSESYEGLMAFGFSAPNRLIYVGKQGAGWTVHADGASTESYDGLLKPGLVFSEDRSRFGFVGMRAGRMRAVIDGVSDGPSYERIGIFDSGVDGGKILGTVLANVALNALTLPLGVVVWVVPKNLQKDVSDVKSIRFSPDGRHYAYSSSDKDRSVIVADGVELQELPAEGAMSALEFEGDGTRLRYKLADSSTWQSLDLPQASMQASESPAPEPEEVGGVESGVSAPPP